MKIYTHCANCRQPVALLFGESLGHHWAICSCEAHCTTTVAQGSSTTDAAPGDLLTKDEHGHLVRLCAELEAREEAALRSQEGPEAQTRAFERAALRKLMGLPADGARRSEVNREGLTLRPGSFYESRAGDVWCCYRIDANTIEIHWKDGKLLVNGRPAADSLVNIRRAANREPVLARARCVLVATGRSEYFFEDGRYDIGGQREHTLIRAVRAPGTTGAGVE